ncbi:MAG: hypothetical protein HY443_01075 [Candidatus Nealsonbacteria bacterium]|nr:hypothetical protein [Candidatus Nealsonbacteria bacterium]
MAPILLTFSVVIMIVAGQILWKLGVTGKIHDFSSFWLAVMTPQVLLGAAIYLVATVVWIYILSKYQYHLVYPLFSLSFVLGLLASRFILHEQVGLVSWVGVGVITLGIIIIGFGFK